MWLCYTQTIAWTYNNLARTFTYFVYEREEGGENKTDGAMVALRHSCLSGFAY